MFDNGSNDTIEFGEGISKDDLIITHGRNKNDLVISIKDTDDSITINSFYQNSGRDYSKSYLIENFKFSNGEVLSHEEFLDLNFSLSSDVVNKVIQDLNSYSNDGSINISGCNEFNNPDIMQLYNV
ncbi:hypothetical protein F1B92_04255 [Campylobacter sp. FMV-PI01]|uniref:Haemolysin-type calcium binding-related domain-containing protein n=1 Tax=Campylobacter portucalensis TaxID=2608384 RepID=A0A6L5WH71_9BACT|nr:hypothetical protein [Campylobacter portucalensis]